MRPDLVQVRRGLFFLFVAISFLYACKDDRIVLTELKASVTTQEKRTALEQIESYYLEAKYHQREIVGVARLAAKADYNIPQLIKIAKILSRIGFHTIPLTGLAKMAANADHNIVELDEIIKFTVILGNYEAMRLAERATDARTEEEKRKVRNQIETLKSSAEFKETAKSIETTNAVNLDVLFSE